MIRQLWTVGHSNLKIEGFIAILREHRIDHLADVRSRPVSRFCPHFNRARLETSLAGAGIAYSYLGGVLGGRPADAALYTDGRADYRKMAASAGVREGLDRLERLADNHNVAAMCSERDPLHCHRFMLVAVEMARRGFTIEHLSAKGIETHPDAVERLLIETGLHPGPMFRASTHEISEAIFARSTTHAFKASPAP